MKTLKIVKILIIITVIYNAWLLLTTIHLQTNFMKYLSLINYQSELLPPWVKLISPTLNIISGWILFVVCALQCSCIVMLLTTSYVPAFLSMVGLCTEGLVYIAMGEIGRADKGNVSNGLVLIVAGLSLFALREREMIILAEYKKK